MKPCLREIVRATLISLINVCNDCFPENYIHFSVSRVSTYRGTTLSLFLIRIPKVSKNGNSEDADLCYRRIGSWNGSDRRTSCKLTCIFNTYPSSTLHIVKRCTRLRAPARRRRKQFLHELTVLRRSSKSFLRNRSGKFEKILIG